MKLDQFREIISVIIAFFIFTRPRNFWYSYIGFKCFWIRISRRPFWLTKKLYLFSIESIPHETMIYYIVTG